MSQFPQTIDDLGSVLVKTRREPILSHTVLVVAKSLVGTQGKVELVDGHRRRRSAAARGDEARRKTLRPYVRYLPGNVDVPGEYGGHAIPADQTKKPVAARRRDDQVPIPKVSGIQVLVRIIDE